MSLFQNKLINTLTFLCLISNQLCSQSEDLKEIFKMYEGSSYDLVVNDINQYLIEDEANKEIKNIPYRFGINKDVNISSKLNGKWTNINNNNIWQLQIQAENAKSLNLRFDVFNISENEELFIYAPEIKKLYGPYSKHNLNVFATPIIPGSSLIISVVGDKKVIEENIHLDRITFGYKGLDDVNNFGLGQSGACNINTICPEGNDWEEQIRSVALIVVGGNSQCTGSLINNTCNDETAYFLTADHCLAAGNPNSYAFHFNFNSPNCTQNITGTIDDFISGSTLLANAVSSDFALLQLSSPPNETFNPYYAGWDRTDNPSSINTTIHHPNGDVKKISIDSNEVVPATQFGTDTWRVLNWELGTTEGGSSGAPLFSENKKIIGQLFGGSASCGNLNGSDSYGRFASSWDKNADTDKQLKFWLDKCNTNELSIEGLDPNQITPFQYDLASQGFENIASKNCSSFFQPQLRIKNKGTENINSVVIYYSINNTLDSIELNGLNIQTNETQLIPIPTLTDITSGINNINVYWNKVNGFTDENINNNNSEFTFYQINNSKDVILNLNTDFYGTETTWQISTPNDYILYSGGPYQDVNGGILINDTFCLSSDSCYAFSIFDNYGDGLENEGFYFITNSNSSDTIIQIQQNNFGSFETQTFCVEDVFSSTNELISSKKHIIYPNPNNGIFYINNSDSNTKIESIRNILGQTISFKQLANGQIQISDKPGTYFVTINNVNEGIKSLNKIIIY